MRCIQRNVKLCYGAVQSSLSIVGQPSYASPSTITLSTSTKRYMRLVASALNNNDCGARQKRDVLGLRFFSSTAADANASQTPTVVLISGTDASGDESMSSLSPPEVVARLDRFIIGQEDAKKAVAIAYRNRWRRKRIPEFIRESVIPKNILMIGPTGCGKTEIARRLAKLADAPFIKVEATKFTEVGYHGGDVDSIIKDLLENAISLVKARFHRNHEKEISKAVEDALLRSLQGVEDLSLSDSLASELEALRKQLRDGELEDKMVEVDPSVASPGKLQLDLTENVQPGVPILINLDKLLSSKKDPKSMKVSEARTLLQNAESQKMLPDEDAVKEAIRLVEEDGIVFIDEIDKIASGSGRESRSRHGGDPSGEGVQRDLLPIIEGSIVNTKQGNVNTENVLFICSGAFHSAKPSDLMPELQGRLPIRVELKPLTRAEFYRILTEPQYNLVKQQQVLLAAEGVVLSFTDEALHEMAKFSEEINRTTDNIGARRLHAVLERVVEEISFKAPELVAEAGGKGLCTVIVDKELVLGRLQPMLKKQDYAKYVL